MEKMEKLNKFRARVFNALADPIRLKILECLYNGEKCVCEITSHISLPQPLVSRQLAILKDCGLVKYRKQGNKRVYSITNLNIFKAIEAINDDFMETLIKHIVEQIA